MNGLSNPRRFSAERLIPVYQEYGHTRFCIQEAMQNLRRHFRSRLAGELSDIEVFYCAYMAYNGNQHHPYMWDRLSADLESYQDGRGYLPHFIAVVYHRLCAAA